jgi:ERCC4-type nuclease
LPLPAGWSELAFGRGPWHGGDHGARNDLVVCDKTEYVSRRAGRLYRAGNQVEVAALDQADELIVRRASGESVRPARTARGRALVKAGDAIELGDGRNNVVRLVLERV